MDPLTLLLAASVFTLIGVIAGIATGLIPGLHVNNVALASVALQGSLISLAMFLFGWADPTLEELLLIVSTLIIGNVVTHTFLDFIPSVFLGAPEGDTALSVLPGHRMLLKGLGYEAVKLSAFGSLMSVFLALCMIIPLRLVMGSPIFAYEKLQGVIFFILLIVVMMLVLTERGEKKTSRLSRPYLSCHVPDGLILSEDEELEGLEAFEPTEIDRLREHLSQAVIVDGVVAEQTDQESFVLAQGESKVKVYLDGQASLEIGAKVKVFGIVKGKLSLLSHLQPKGLALGVFLLAGILGFIILGTPGFAQNNWYPIPQLVIDSSMVAFFPLFTGLFGVSTLLISLNDQPSIPPQEIDDDPPKIEGWRKTRAVMSGTVAGTFVGWFPGISAASATVIAKLLGGGEPKKVDSLESNKEFMIAISGVNTATGIFTILALFVILKARSGAMNAVKLMIGKNIVPWEPLQNVPFQMSLMLFSVLLAALVAYGLTHVMGKMFARRFSRVPYKKLVIGVLSYLVIMIFLFSGPLGLVVGGVATCIGMIPPLIGVKRVHLMGCLILPIMTFFLG
ncbi:MAG: tripartite tricarboxylate transporter permease [Thermoplasmata archaeon]|nr:tripartite tricarboxylate transporter permease [Thermoplasmata archaeon]